MRESGLISNWMDWLRECLWPEDWDRRCIHGMGALVAGGTLLFWGSIWLYEALFSEAHVSLWMRLLFGGGALLSIGVLTTLATLVPYALGSLAARTARRPSLVVAACGLVLLSSLSFRIYVYGIVGGSQAFINMILHTIPFSTVVLGGWGIDVGLRFFAGDEQSPSVVLASMLGTAIFLGLGGTLAIWFLRNSSMWIVVGGPLSLSALGLGFWATWQADQEGGRTALHCEEPAPNVT